MKKLTNPNDAYRIRSGLKGRNIVFVGMMGAGKSAIGKRLAVNLDLPFVDADAAIEEAAGMSIPDIFETFGEDHFRDGERKVIARLMADDPMILSTGGGAFMNDQTREFISRKAVSIWLRAELDVLMERVKRKDKRPLLKTEDPEATMRELMEEREPYYAKADLTVQSRNESHGSIVLATVESLLNFLDEEHATT